jgi:hypothetical protein
LHVAENQRGSKGSGCRHVFPALDQTGNESAQQNAGDDDRCRNDGRIKEVPEKKTGELFHDSSIGDMGHVRYRGCPLKNPEDPESGSGSLH